MRRIEDDNRPIRRARRSFRKDSSGATAVEFALIALPFIAMMGAIIETGILYFADSALDNATSEASRLIRTGQAQQSGFDAAAFRQKVCDGVTPLFTCSGIKVDVRTTTDFSSADVGTPVKADGSFDDSKFQYDAGHGTDIVVVRVYYEWPAMLNLLAKDSSLNGNHLLAAVTAFRNEPFSW
jgi:Flp pilus assembly protein TadG